MCLVCVGSVDASVVTVRRPVLTCGVSQSVSQSVGIGRDASYASRRTRVISFSFVFFFFCIFFYSLISIINICFSFIHNYRILIIPPPPSAPHRSLSLFFLSNRLYISLFRRKNIFYLILFHCLLYSSSRVTLRRDFIKTLEI